MTTERKLSEIFRWIEAHNQDGFIDCCSHVQNLDRIFDPLYDKLDWIERENARLKKQIDELLLSANYYTKTASDSYEGKLVAFDCRERLLTIQADNMPSGKPGHRLGARVLLAFLADGQS